MNSPRFDFSAVRARLHPTLLFGLVAAAAIIGGLGIFLRSHGASTTVPDTAVHTVTIKSVADLASAASPLSIVGTVQSNSEATVLAESSGQVIGAYRTLGQSVGAGTIVAELENASQRAAVLQAQGTVDAASASLAKVKAGTRPEQLANLQSAVDGARSGAVSTLLSSYAAVDNAVRGGVDTFFSTPDGPAPQFSITTPDSHLVVKIVNERASLGIILTREHDMSSAISTSDDVAAELTRTQTELRVIRDFIDDIILALNKAIPTTTISAANIATYQASAIASRASINAALSSVAGALQTLQTAQNNATLGVRGAQTEDVQAAEATLKQAQGAYAAALATLEKTRIRAPISGTINSFNLKRGDYVSQGTPVLTVANNGALEVVAYMTEQDRNDIRVGDQATLDNGAAGAVTRVAPALDPVTKKIEVRIGITSGAATLVNGQSVTATFARHAAALGGAHAALSIPITAIKVGADNTMSVFTLNTTDGTLQAHPVVLGELMGDRVVVQQGLAPEMLIVTDARGLRAGESVLAK